ncbi:MAG: type II CRISPR-associated endonuclease Cas1 [Oscillospiraceae bacterium]|nr:type II CRISPR-associated endonuclease Cas1 [Oscillospiraceae bacterium]
MSWRIVVISNQCKLSYKNNHLVVKNDNIKMIHLSEINTVVIDTTLVSITTVLLCECMNRKIKVIFCDERHNPKGEVISYYGSHNTSKKIINQIKWSVEIKDAVWSFIIKNKIINQSKTLSNNLKDNHDKLNFYAEEVQIGDVTNREGHSAKVYFHSLFGSNFARSSNNSINSALDYGYSILLSNFNKEIVANGYLTQLGIHHRNEFNFFNLSCDFMEPFRSLVDDIVYKNKDMVFGKEYKFKLIDVLNSKIRLNNCEYYLTNAIPIYVSSLLKALDSDNLDYLIKVEVL